MRTFGIQHGIIHDLQPNYHFTNNDKMRNITAQCTFVWGSNWETKLYSQGNYPDNSILQTGIIRTDVIPIIKQTNIQSIPVVKKDEWTAIFATQPINDENLRRQIAFEVFAAFKKIENCRLQIKLHPAEINGISYYSQIANEVGLSDIQIYSSTDLYLLISRADIVITSFSTVGLESVFFNKPLITIDPLEQDIQNYVKDKVAFQAKDSHQIKNYIFDLISGSIGVNQQDYKKYLEKQAYKIDGKASSRCLYAIKSYKKNNYEI